MSRDARRKDPAPQPKIKLELREGHYTLRLICVGVALLVAALAFASVLNSPTQVKSGWQQIMPQDSVTPAGQEFLLCYNLGQTEQKPEQELNDLVACYTGLLDQGYRVLSNTEQTDCVNLRTLNQQPNTALAVDDILYNALKTWEASSSRLIYFAPLMERYYSLFASTYDHEAEEFDPTHSQEAADFAREIAAFATDPEAIQLKLLPQNTVRLEISPEYLAYAREHQVDSFLDMGIALNAFLCDVVAEGLTREGFENGYVTSFDGYTRAMCADEFALNVFDRVDGQARQLGTVLYHTPGAVVSCRAFPVLEGDVVNYFTYSDGTVRAPYLNDRGELHCAAASLNTFSPTLSAGVLALRTLAAYAGEDSTFADLEDLSWAAGENQQIILHGDAFTLPE